MKNKQTPDAAYRTTKGGKIEAPKKQEGAPVATRTAGNDLRVRRGKA